MKKLLAGGAVLVFLVTGCTWQDAAKVTANAAVYSAMIATGNGGDWNMHADYAGQLAAGFTDLALESSNASCP